MRTAPEPTSPSATFTTWRRLRPGRGSPRLLAAALAVLGTAAGRAAYSPPPPGSTEAVGWSRVPGVTHDVLVVLGIGVALLVVLLMWARYFRRKRHSQSTPRGSHHFATDDPEDADRTERRRHRRKRRRRDHRSRNPTLAETGGLPPPRAEGGSTS